jgi:hypothetical protein
MILFFDLMYYLCISISFAYMWSFTEIFIPVRNFVAKIPYVRRPLLCPECSSFWIGLFVSFIYNPIILDMNILFLTNICCGLVTHLFACILYKFINKYL